MHSDLKYNAHVYYEYIHIITYISQSQHDLFRIRANDSACSCSIACTAFLSFSCSTAGHVLYLRAFSEGYNLAENFWRVTIQQRVFIGLKFSSLKVGKTITFRRYFAFIYQQIRGCTLVKCPLLTKSASEPLIQATHQLQRATHSSKQAQKSASEPFIQLKQFIVNNLLRTQTKKNIRIGQRATGCFSHIGQRATFELAANSVQIGQRFVLINAFKVCRQTKATHPVHLCVVLFLYFFLSILLLSISNL